MYVTPGNYFNLDSFVKTHESNVKKMSPEATHFTAEVRLLFRLSEAQPTCSLCARVTQAVIVHFGLGLSAVTPGSKC